ncbi:MAG: hypothetical protein HQ513_04780 [Rhodospirillales bacterium]|nr:hypothetical protein [Rhodospirillales bacterium]
MPKKQSRAQSVPFIDAEEAWFWFMRSQRARLEGAKMRSDEADIVRPCDPDDLYRAAMALVRRRILGRYHLKVLASFGMQECAPDPRVREQQRASRLWVEALDRLTTILRKKGIVE